MPESWVWCKLPQCQDLVLKVRIISHFFSNINPIGHTTILEQNRSLLDARVSALEANWQDWGIEDISVSMDMLTVNLDIPSPNIQANAQEIAMLTSWRDHAHDQMIEEG